MQMQQYIEQEQRQVLSQALRQSLQPLQMPVAELAEYLQEQALSNPLLEVETVQPTSEYMESVHVIEDEGRRRGGGQGSERMPDAISASTRPESFSEYLTEQVNCMPQIDEKMRAICCFLIECLDPTGYMSCDLQELAKEMEMPLYDVEQALYLLQMLEPAGVGARDMTECLLLQLAQSRDFNAVNIRMVREGLPLLARRDYAGLSRLLHVSIKEVRDSEEIVKGLNPIPSRGFYSGDTYSNYIVPEAVIFCRDGQFVVEMNTRSLPRVRLSDEYMAMMGNPVYRDAQEYLRERMAAAKAVIAQIDSRQSTLYRLLSVIIRRQQEYFVGGEALQPMTMQQVAEELQLSTSTVSRAVKDKYVQHRNKMIPLRSLFTASLQGSDGSLISADTAKQQLRLFVRAENEDAPLSDEALVSALASVGVEISRRTVAKYRAELGIPAAAARRKRL